MVGVFVYAYDSKRKVKKRKDSVKDLIRNIGDMVLIDERVEEFLE